MTQLTFEIEIDATVDRVWDVLAEFGDTYRYNPGVSSSHLTSARTQDVGMTRHCDLTFPGATVEERILDWRDGERYTLEIYDGQKLPPFRSAGATLAVRADGADRTVVTAELAYEMKFGLAGALMDKMVVEPKFGAAFASLLAGLKHHLETGEAVTADTDLSAEHDALHGVAAAA